MPTEDSKKQSSVVVCPDTPPPRGRRSAAPKDKKKMNVNDHDKNKRSFVVCPDSPRSAGHQSVAPKKKHKMNSMDPDKNKLSFVDCPDMLTPRGHRSAAPKEKHKMNSKDPDKKQSFDVNSDSPAPRRCRSAAPNEKLKMNAKDPDKNKQNLVVCPDKPAPEGRRSGAPKEKHKRAINDPDEVYANLLWGRRSLSSFKKQKLAISHPDCQFTSNTEGRRSARPKREIVDFRASPAQPIKSQGRRSASPIKNPTKARGGGGRHTNGANSERVCAPRFPTEPLLDIRSHAIPELCQIPTDSASNHSGSSKTLSNTRFSVPSKIPRYFAPESTKLIKSSTSGGVPVRMNQVGATVAGRLLDNPHRKETNERKTPNCDPRVSPAPSKIPRYASMTAKDDDDDDDDERNETFAFHAPPAFYPSSRSGLPPVRRGAFYEAAGRQEPKRTSGENGARQKEYADESHDSYLPDSPTEEKNSTLSIEMKPIAVVFEGSEVVAASHPDLADRDASSNSFPEAQHLPFAVGVSIQGPSRDGVEPPNETQICSNPRVSELGSSPNGFDRMNAVSGSFCESSDRARDYYPSLPTSNRSYHPLGHISHGNDSVGLSFAERCQGRAIENWVTSTVDQKLASFDNDVDNDGDGNLAVVDWGENTENFSSDSIADELGRRRLLGLENDTFHPSDGKRDVLLSGTKGLTGLHNCDYSDREDEKTELFRTHEIDPVIDDLKPRQEVDDDDDDFFSCSSSVGGLDFPNNALCSFQDPNIKLEL